MALDTEIIDSIKKIDQKTKDIVFGYTREMQYELPNRIIPNLVSFKCLLFYHIDIRETEAMEAAFDQWIDFPYVCDVNIDEWCLGLTTLLSGSNGIEETEQRKIFKFIDKTQNIFIDKKDFVQFMTFNYGEYKNAHSLIMNAINHPPRPRTLSTSSQDWADYDMELLEQEMVAAMPPMSSVVESMNQQVHEEEEFKNEMEKRMNETPDILKLENARNWSKYEVVNWLESIGMEKYYRFFAQEAIDGQMLLDDIDRDMLEMDLGVKVIDAIKIMRQIDILKKAVMNEMGLLLVESDFICTQNIVDDKIGWKHELDKVKQFYENELQKLRQRIIELENQQ